MQILRVSIKAGGGHKAAMDSLGQSLQQFTPHVHIESFVSVNTPLEHAPRLAYTLCPRLYNLLYKATAKRSMWHRTYFGMTRSLIQDIYTVYERLESHVGILLVHRINPGPERFNLAFLLHHNLAHYVPNEQALLHLLTTFGNSPHYRTQSQRAFGQATARERAAARARAQQTAEFVVRIAAQRPTIYLPAGCMTSGGEI